MNRSWKKKVTVSRDNLNSPKKIGNPEIALCMIKRPRQAQAYFSINSQKMEVCGLVIWNTLVNPPLNKMKVNKAEK